MSLGVDSEHLNEMSTRNLPGGKRRQELEADNLTVIYIVFGAQAEWILTHTSHKDTEQSTTEASITLDDVTLTDPLIR
jgi:hypothetical protein